MEAENPSFQSPAEPSGFDGGSGLLDTEPADHTSDELKTNLTDEGNCRDTGSRLGVRGEPAGAFDRRCIPPGLRCSSLTYLEYARYSRVAVRARHRFRRDAGFHCGLLDRA